jgi:hypothetical protein
MLIKVIIVGGGYGSLGVASVNPTYQFFQVSSNTITAANYLPLIQGTNPINLYPFTIVLPGNGLVMMISGARTRFYTCADSLPMSNFHLLACHDCRKSSVLSAGGEECAEFEFYLSFCKCL